MEQRIPPQNLDAEKAVIASILIDTAALEKVVDLLIPQNFYDPKHEILFEAIIDLYKKNKPIDTITITNELRKKKKLKQSGGVVYISELVTLVPTASNVKEYGQAVRDAAVRRELISFSAELDEKSRNESLELEDLLNQVEGKLLSLSKESASQDFFDTSTLIEQQMKKADEYAKNPDGIRGIPTGVKSLDKLISGLHSSDLIVLAARPSVGKSAFVFNIARHAAVNEGKTVAIFSLEMPAVQVIERILSQQIQVDLWKIRMGNMNQDEYQKYNIGAAKLSESNLLVDETAGINIVQLRSKVRKLMIEKGLDLVIIDYLQLMQSREIENRAQAVGEISRSLKILARELNIPIIALSQLNRALENRTGADKIPQLSDLRESGSIEQDADLVMFLSRDSMFDEENEGSGYTEIKVDLHVAKHRNGPIGKCSLKFLANQQRYEDYE